MAPTLPTMLTKIYSRLNKVYVCMYVVEGSLSGLCSRGIPVPQATNFYIWMTRKTYFFHIRLSAGHPEFNG